MRTIKQLELNNEFELAQDVYEISVKATFYERGFDEACVLIDKYGERLREIVIKHYSNKQILFSERYEYYVKIGTCTLSRYQF